MEFLGKSQVTVLVIARYVEPAWRIFQTKNSTNSSFRQATGKSAQGPGHILVSLARQGCVFQVRAGIDHEHKSGIFRLPP